MQMTQIKEATRTLSWSDLSKLWTPDSVKEDRQGVVRQLLSRAAAHQRSGQPAPGPEALETGYEEAIRRAVEGTRQAHARLSQEKRDAGRMFHLLEAYPPARRRIQARNDRRFQTWGFFECLAERSRDLMERDPQAAVETAELALAVAQGLPASVYGEERVYDFQAEALTLLTQARRVSGDLKAAGEALEHAGALLALGTGDLLAKAELESARAALLRDLGRPEEAEAAGRRAVSLAHRAGGPRDPRRRGLDESHSDLRRGGRTPIPAFRPRRH
jgi:tetratricopeptide (TPR) repeat protein